MDKKKDQGWLRGVGSLLVCAAGVMLCLAGVQVYRGMQKRAVWQRVQGVVVELGERNRGHEETSYTASFSFTEPTTGSRYTVRGKLGTGMPRFQRGQRVELLYPEGEPEQAVPDTMLDIYHPAIGLGVGAVVLAVFGLSLWRVRHRTGPEPGEALTDTGIRIRGRRILLPRGGLLGSLFHLPRPRPQPPHEAADSPTPPEDEAGTRPPRRT